MGTQEAKVILSIKNNTRGVSTLHLKLHNRVMVIKSAKLWATKTNMFKKEIKEDPEINSNSHRGFGKSAKTVLVFSRNNAAELSVYRQKNQTRVLALVHYNISSK